MKVSFLQEIWRASCRPDHRVGSQQAISHSGVTDFQMFEDLNVSDDLIVDLLMH